MHFMPLKLDTMTTEYMGYNMKSFDEMRELNLCELENINGGHDDNTGGFWYSVGKFFAQQANASDAIKSQYGRTNQNHYW